MNTNIHTTMNPGYHGHGGGGGSGGMAPRSGERYPSPPSGERYPSPGSGAASVNVSGHGPQNHSKNSHGSTGSHHSVGFSRYSNKDDQYQEERKKYLTAKYPQHQMRLIRKRLEVEDWVDKQLRELYNVTDDTDSYDCEIDLDDLLDLDETSERRSFIMEHLTNVPKSREAINRFVEDLLEKASTL